MKRLALISIVGLLALAACGDDKPSSDTSPTEVAVATTTTTKNTTTTSAAVTTKPTVTTGKAPATSKMDCDSLRDTLKLTKTNRANAQVANAEAEDKGQPATFDDATLEFLRQSVEDAAYAARQAGCDISDLVGANVGTKP